MGIREGSSTIWSPNVLLYLIFCNSTLGLFSTPIAIPTLTISNTSIVVNTLPSSTVSFATTKRAFINAGVKDCGAGIVLVVVGVVSVFVVIIVVRCGFDLCRGCCEV